MRHKSISTLLVVFLLVLAVAAFPQTMKKTGISGASILKVGVGAKAVGIGSAITTVTNDVNQLFWNPAGISMPEGETQVTFSYNKWIADINHNAFAVSHSFGSWGTLALGGLMSGINDIEANRDVQPGLEGVEYSDAAMFDYNSAVIGLSYARQFTDKLSMGATVKYYSEKIDVETVGTLAFDFGAIYMLGYRDLAIGARIQNLGGDLEYYYVPFSLPMVFSFGVSMSMIQSDDFSFKGYVDATKPLDADQMILGGLEATLLKNISFRAGYKFNYMGMKDEFGPRSSYQIVEKVTRDHWYDQKTYARTDEGLSLGAGIVLPYSGHDLVVDYSWSQFDLMDDVNRLSVSFKF
ncbi:MAG TPA: PorV/PorQ family protein [bacterium]|nr:PorV/PorQ family protein [bacterium]HPN33275.1 PorV/PorQ family protein [bacterium]